MGDIQLLAREAPQLLRDARERDDRSTVGALIYSETTRRLALDDADAALQLLLEHEQLCENEPCGSLHVGLLTRGVDVYIYRGELERAFEHYPHQLSGHSWAAHPQRLLAANAVCRAACAAAVPVRPVVARITKLIAP